MINSKTFSKGSLAHNTLMLYILTASSYLFSFATLPYLTRVLGVETYGKVGFGTAFSSYVQLFVSFGFILSGTAKIASCDRDAKEMSRVLSSVTIAKLLLAVVSAALLTLLCIFVKQFREDAFFYTMYLVFAVANALLPDFVYRGIEKMTMVTLGTVTIKAIFLVGVFAFVNDSEHYVLVPALYALGAIVADIIMFAHLSSSLCISFVRVSITEVRESMRDSAQFFLSRVATTFYTSLNTLVLGFVMPGSVGLGQFTACNNAIHAGKSLSSPVADSLYPYMIRTKKYSLLTRVLFVGEAILIPACIVIAIFAPNLCEWFFGQGYYAAGNLMRILILLIPISLASYLLGFPALSPMGKASVANSSVIFGAILQVVLILIMFVLDAVTPSNICIATCLSEGTVLLMRTKAFWEGIKVDEMASGFE